MKGPNVFIRSQAQTLKGIYNIKEASFCTVYMSHMSNVITTLVTENVMKRYRR